MAGTLSYLSDTTEVQRVLGRFESSAQMEDAIARLTLLGFDRGDLSIAEAATEGRAPLDGEESKTAYTEQDARQARTLHVSGAAAAAALAGAAITIGTGGLGAAAVGVALAAGAAAGGGAFAVSTAANAEEQQDRDDKAASGGLTLTVRVQTPELRGKAEAALRDAGAARVSPA
jgi:hypothetical protein